MTVLIVCAVVAALIAFILLMAALRSGASDPGFTIESDQTRQVDGDDEGRAA